MRKNARPLKRERLIEVLDYDKDTGIFKWKINMYRAKAGDVAGHLMKIGYWSITIDQIPYYAHRLAWLYVEGQWPQFQIDHKNEKKEDNRWCNLRQATKSDNMKNCGRRRDNTSGIKGVTWHNQTRKWAAAVTTNGVSERLGLFADLQDAAQAVKHYRKLAHGEFTNHG